MKEYKYDPTDSGRWALSFDLVCSVLLFLYCLACIALLSSTCGKPACHWEKLAQELLVRFLWPFVNFAARCWDWWFLQDWTTAAGSCLVSACLEDWSAAAELYLVFALGLDCWQRRLSSPPKNYCWTGPLPPYPFFSTTSGGWWARGEIEPLLIK